MNLKVKELNNNSHVPQHVRGIINAIIEEAKAYPNGELNVVHDQRFHRTQLAFRDNGTGERVAATLSHTVYPEEVVVVAFEDHRKPNVVHLSRDTFEPPMLVHQTRTRHYQPKQYLGRDAANNSNSRQFETEVTRLDEAKLPTDVFNFLRLGTAPA